MKNNKQNASQFFSKKKTQQLYQNLWHLCKLTKKQQKWAKLKKKMYSTELNRPIRKYGLFRILNKPFALNKQYYCTTKSKTKTMMHSNFKKGLHLKKALCLIVKPFWFLNKAMPIPGVSFLKKANVRFMRKLSAYKIVKSWLGTINKKQRIALLNVQKKQNLSKIWNIVVLMESQHESIARKTAFCQNGPQRNSIFQCKNRTMNGKMKQNTNTISKPADLFFQKNTTLFRNLCKNSHSFFMKLSSFKCIISYFIKIS